MENDILLNLRKNIEDADASLRSHIADNIVQHRDETSEQQQMLQDLQTVSKLLGIFEKNEPQKKTTVTTQRKGSGTLLSLDDDLRNLRISAVCIDRREYPAKYIRDVARVICSWLANKMSEQFESSIGKFATSTSKEIFISLDPKDIDESKADVVTLPSGKNVYINACRMTIDRMCALKKVLEVMEIDPERIKLRIDESYLRKQRMDQPKAQKLL